MIFICTDVTVIEKNSCLCDRMKVSISILWHSVINLTQQRSAIRIHTSEELCLWIRKPAMLDIYHSTSHWTKHLVSSCLILSKSLAFRVYLWPPSVISVELQKLLSSFCCSLGIEKHRILLWLVYVDGIKISLPHCQMFLSCSKTKFLRS